MALIKSCLQSATTKPNKLAYGIQSGTTKAGYYVNNGVSTDFVGAFPSDMGWCTYSGGNDITIAVAGTYNIKVNSATSSSAQSSQSDTTQAYAVGDTINFNNLVTYGSIGIVEITRVS